MVAAKGAAKKKGKGAQAKPARIVLLDAHAILHRAYHALPDFTSNNGEPTGALYGLSAMLFKIIEELSPAYILACYDLPEATFRHTAYEGYKAGRAKADDLLVAQLIRSRDVFATFGIPIFEKPGFEADDLLGTLAAHFKTQKGCEVIIASGDMDTLQLVDKARVRVYTLRKGIQDTILYDEDAVVARFGFPPKLLPDYKGLRGDPSDNIIGIKGIGEKTATELITRFGTIESMYKVLKKKDGEAVFADAGIKPRIVNLLIEGEEEALFSKELATIRCDVDVPIELPEKEWREGLDTEAVLALFNELGFRTLSARFKSQYMDASAPEADVPERPTETVDADELTETAIALWLLRSDITNPSLEDILAYGNDRSFRDARERILRDLEKEGLMEVFTRIERPLIPIVAKMSAHGVLVDRDRLASLATEYHRELSALEQTIYAHAGAEFNINSPRQLGNVLFDTLALSTKGQKRTATGQRSTRESELEKLRDEHPIIADILEYREVQKLLSTYIDVIPTLLGEDDRLHAQFLQAGTTTGRMASQHPNLQNIPIKTERGRRIRDAFVVPERSALVAFDYSQVELRIAAFLSGDATMIDLFKRDADIHRAVAAAMFAVAPEAVEYEMRRRAKVINFGILYGMGVNALRANLGVSRAEAQEYLTHYFQNFSGLAEYLEETKRSAARLGYTTTFFGRKRYFEGIRSRIPQVKASAERMAINAPIQGTQADLTKLAMIAVDRWITEAGYEERVHLVLQIHDELVYEIDEALLAEVRPQIIECMQSILSPEETKGVPIVVDSKAGKHWGAME
jgi:DNA polymerase I